MAIKMTMPHQSIGLFAGEQVFSKSKSLRSSIPSLVLRPPASSNFALASMYVWSECGKALYMRTLHRLHFTPGLQSAFNNSMHMTSVTSFLICKQEIMEYEYNRTNYMYFTALYYLSISCPVNWSPWWFCTADILSEILIKSVLWQRTITLNVIFPNTLWQSIHLYHLQVKNFIPTFCVLQFL